MSCLPNVFFLCFCFCFSPTKFTSPWLRKSGARQGAGMLIRESGSAARVILRRARSQKATLSGTCQTERLGRGLSTPC